VHRRAAGAASGACDVFTHIGARGRRVCACVGACVDSFACAAHSEARIAAVRAGRGGGTRSGARCAALAAPRAFRGGGSRGGSRGAAFAAAFSQAVAAARAAALAAPRPVFGGGARSCSPRCFF
jgi:hypothetical protein